MSGVFAMTLNEAQDHIATLERELSEAKEREARLRAHIHGSAMRAHSDASEAWKIGQKSVWALSEMADTLRDWHLAALEQNNG